MNTLATEVGRFRQWAQVRLSGDFIPDQYSHGAEWECDYPGWQEMYMAVERFLKSAAESEMTSDEAELVLYALARDNEDEHILGVLQTYPALAIQLARSALTYSDSAARWQAAVLLGRLCIPEASELLRCFLIDEAEYVRRRARIALDEADAEPGAPPNGGSVTRLGDSGVAVMPPSVS